MLDTALFVDLSNFYNDLLRSEIDEREVLKDYFLEWLDFDRLAEALTGECSSVWIFYSGSKLGPKEQRIQDKRLTDYIKRINSLQGVTARDVNIPGEQREQGTYKCECGREGVAEWVSEKGVDASLTVHLFDTMDSWQIAYLLSGDADYVPVVGSLRRRGKIVIGAGFSSPSSALVRECYHYVDLRHWFLKDDVFAYRMFGLDGVVARWLCNEVKSTVTIDPLQFKVEWSGYSRPDRGRELLLIAPDHAELEARHGLLEDLRPKYPDNFGEFHKQGKRCQLFIGDKALAGVERRLDALVSSLDMVQRVPRIPGGILEMTHKYNPNTKQYERSPGD